MTATVNGTNWQTVLRRAEMKAVNSARDYIEVMAAAIEQHIAEWPVASAAEPAVDAHVTKLETELGRMRHQLGEANSAITSARAERDTARGRLEDARIQMAERATQRPDTELGEKHAQVLAENVELADRIEVQRQELDAVLAERDQLRGEVKAAIKLAKTPKPAPHRHVYEWPDPEDLPGPCSCGRPYPRALFDTDDDEDWTLQPWDQLMEDVRAELEEAGFPETTDYEDPVTSDDPTLEVPTDEPTDVARSTRRPVAQCGTDSGYTRHKRRGEDACEPCKNAHREYSNAHYAAAKAREAGEPS